MKKTLTILTFFIMILLLVSCAEVKEDIIEDEVVPINYEDILKDTNPEVTINIKDLGSMTIQLFPEIAKETVDNFLSYALEGSYEGSIFHRVIKNFMIQGGIVEESKMPIDGEFNSNGFENNLLHTVGVISMARTANPNSATSEFFIVHKVSKHLDGNYAAFGGMVDGFEVLELIANIKTDYNDQPIDDIVIESVTVELNGYLLKDM